MYNTIKEIKDANKDLGQHWFNKATMSYFNSRIVSGVIMGQYFITSEENNYCDEKKKYTARIALPDGSIDTIGQFYALESIKDAKKAIVSHSLTK